MPDPASHTAPTSTPTGSGRRIALVTGAASGIGRALAEALATRGIEVVLADRQMDVAEDVARGIRARDGAATVAELDVRSHERFAAVVQETVARGGRLDYLFNNAGIGVSGEIKDYEPADWDDVFDVNLRGVAYGIQAAYPVMIRQGFGHIVNTASMAGLVAGGGAGSYVATKHAVVGLSKALRMEAKEHGVKVSVLCPGFVRTPILEGGRYGRLKYKLDTRRLPEIWERLRPLDPATLAHRALLGVERNQAIIVVPTWWRAFWYLDRLSPWLAEHAFGVLYRRGKRDLEALRID